VFETEILLLVKPDPCR